MKHLRSFGRIKGHKLSEKQRDLIENFLPQIRPDVLKINSNKILFEIGFGGGEHLVQLISERSDNQTVIGCEPYINGAVKLVKYIYENDIENVYIHDGDARELIEKLPENSIEKFFILFPDPWPKKKHHKRRIINEVMINLLLSKLSENGKATIVTDHISYAEWIHKNLSNVKYEFKKLNSKNECQAKGIFTRYCEKALKNNLAINYFLIKK
jgi:tRNA (guanine-N7-)-methyltransferase